MSASPKPQPASRRTAFVVLAVALAATFFAGWREHELARSNLIIRWQNGFTQLQPVLGPLLGQRFETLHDQARAALDRAHYSEAGWNEFLTVSEWQQRFPGMKELGYAYMDGEKCVVKFLASREPAPAHAPGFDLESDPVIRKIVQASADAGYGSGSKPVRVGADQVVTGLLTLQKRAGRPGTALENRANLRGFVFFVLEQREYFQSVQPQLKNLPFDIRLLAPDEPDPAKTDDQRPFGSGGASGTWRFAGTMKPPSAAAFTSQWIVLIGGTALSLLMFALFSTQARLRHEAERASEKIQAREAEITALNRDLEAKIAKRTAELNVALAEEKELNRLKGNFISMVTHEIRTPLALILGSSEILSRYLERLTPDKRTEHLQTIDAAVQRMSELLEDVLLFSKAEAGRMEFNPVELDLKSFCTQLVDELLSATNRRCPIELSVDSDGPGRGDEGLLRHIFSNLITNAVKYSPPGTPVKFCLSRDGGNAVFIVQDRGMGIPEVDRKRLFTPFYRGKNVTTIQGTGLGLVIVKHCVERHGGRIEVDSMENLGTTVSVQLPLFSPAHTEFVKRISQNPTE